MIAVVVIPLLVNLFYYSILVDGFKKRINFSSLQKLHLRNDDINFFENPFKPNLKPFSLATSFCYINQNNQDFSPSLQSRNMNLHSNRNVDDYSNLSVDITNDNSLSKLHTNDSSELSTGTNNLTLQETELIQDKSTDGKLQSEADNSFLTRECLIVLSLLFLVSAICALDRVAMSVAIIPMSLDLRYTESVKGTISSMFSFGYLFGLLPAGILGSFASPKLILSFGVFIWSLAQGLSPFAAKISLSALYVIRFLMGVAEAVAIPTIQNFVSRWVPDTRRSLVLGLVLSGLQAGNVLAYLISPVILQKLQWPGLFISYGIIGLFWLALWLPFSKDQPTITSSFASDDVNTERTDLSVTDITIDKNVTNDQIDPLSNDNAMKDDFIAVLMQKTKDYKDKLFQIPWKNIIASKEVQAISVAHAVQNFGLYINLAWLPSYFYEKYSLSVMDSSLSSVLPWLAGAIVGPVSGIAADRFLQSGIERTVIRKVAQSIALLCPALTLLCLSNLNEISSQDAIKFFVAAVASSAFYVSGFGSSVQDLCKSSNLVSIIYSLTSAPAVLFGSFGVYLTGLILDSSHNWSFVFQGTAIVYILGAIFYATQYEAKKIFD